MESYVLDTKIKKLSKPYFNEKKDIYFLLKELKPNELEYVFNNEVVFKKFLYSNYEYFFMIFRMVPASIQEKYWEYNHIQKLLLRFQNVTDEQLANIIEHKKFYFEKKLDKKEKRHDFYFNPDKVRDVENFLNSIKSSKIKDSLVSNYYFQIIVLYCKKLPRNFINSLDRIKFMRSVESSSIYNYLSNNQKYQLCHLANVDSKSFTLPNDYESFMFEKAPDGTYRGERRIGRLLRIMLWYLDKNDLNGNYNLDYHFLSLLSNLEIASLLKSNRIDHTPIYNFFYEQVKNRYEHGEKFDYVEIKNSYVEFFKFKIYIDLLIKNGKKEEIVDDVYAHIISGEYSEEEMIEIKNAIGGILPYLNYDDFEALLTIPQDVKSIFFLRFNKIKRDMCYLDSITERQMLKLNVKHIQILIPYIEKIEVDQDELSDIYAKAIKLYFVFGLEKARDILSGKYGKVTKTFMDNISRLQTNNVFLIQEGKKYLPKTDDRFINFLFSQNMNIKKLFVKDDIMAQQWSSIYNFIDDLEVTCKGHISTAKAEIFLKDNANNVSYKVNPLNYKLNDYLYEIGLGNKTYAFSNEDVYAEAEKTFDQQRKRKTSTIPYVKGESKNGYSYEMMRLNDPIAYVLGYRAGCCIRIKDIAHKHLLHALLCENGRILLIKDRDGKIVGFSPLKRNGEALIANSIERIDKSDENKYYLGETFIDAMKDIVNTSAVYEQDTNIKVVTIGRQSAGLFNPILRAWPKEIEVPTILEKKDQIYGETDVYHRNQSMIYIDSKVNLKKIKYGEVSAIYEDPREPIKASQQIEWKSDDHYYLESVRYSKYKKDNKDRSYEPLKPYHFYYIKYLIRNDDWYIMVMKDDTVKYDIQTTDEKAVKEMKATLEIVYQRLKDNTLDSYILQMKH